MKNFKPLSLMVAITAASIGYSMVSSASPLTNPNVSKPTNDGFASSHLMAPDKTANIGCGSCNVLIDARDPAPDTVQVMISKYTSNAPIALADTGLIAIAIAPDDVVTATVDKVVTVDTSPGLLTEKDFYATADHNATAGPPIAVLTLASVVDQVTTATANSDAVLAPFG